MNLEQYLLIKLIEEAAEIQQRATKMLRFGINEIQPGQEKENVERLFDELIDFTIVVDKLSRHPSFVLDVKDNFSDSRAKKEARFEEYLNYSKKMGLVVEKDKS